MSLYRLFTIIFDPNYSLTSYTIHLEPYSMSKNIKEPNKKILKGI